MLVEGFYKKLRESKTRTRIVTPLGAIRLVFASFASEEPWALQVQQAWEETSGRI
jgi:hypothetical protein